MSEPTSRRDFLTGVFRKLAKPAGRAVAAFETAAPLNRPRRVMRPPGAVEEPEFLGRCERSGKCIEACPAQAIRRWEGHDPHMWGTPFIAPDLQACVLCDSLACMSACPSGALKPTERGAVRIGRPKIDHPLCLRFTGEECRVCVERCPVGADAIRLDADGRVTFGDACTGCGVCQQFCPARPKAITVLPQ